MEREYFDQSDRLNERKVTLKRKYTENYPAITAGKSARIRNKMLEAIADGKITQDQFNAMLSELSADSKRWMKRNSKFFSISEDGVTLTKSGSRILKQIKIEKPTMRKLVMESFNDFASNDGVNENVELINERYVKSVGYKAAAERIEDLARQLDPNSRLCKGISKGADNVAPEFKEMKKHMDEIYTIWQEIEYTIEMSNESVVTEDVLCEATVEMDAMDPDNKDFLKFLKKNRVKIISKDMLQGPHGGTPVITMQGKRKDLENVLADGEYGWDDADLAEYIEESVNENMELKKLEDAIKMFQDKIKGQGRVTNARDEEHLENLIRIYKEMGGKKIKESVDTEIITEAFKSSKLRNLMNATDTSGRDIKQLADAFYGFSKLKLDKVEDQHLQDFSASGATKQFRSNKDVVVFYIIDNEKENPYAPRDNYNYNLYTTLRPGILAVTVGGNFVGIDQSVNKTAGKYKYKKTLGKAKETAIGGNKNYSGWDATGLATLKRISEVADRAIVINMQALRDDDGGFDSRKDIANRVDAKSGAIAFKSDKDFKKANMARYQEILSTKAAKLPLDKMVEDAINLLTKHIADAIKTGEKTSYGEIKLGQDKKGRDIKATDASNMMSNILHDFERYVRYMSDAEKEKESGYSTGYYEKSAKEYAKNISDRVKKVKNMDYAW